MTAPLRNFRGHRRFAAPRWLTDGEGGLVGYALDIMRDALLERVRLGMLARFPQQDANGTPGPTDALTAMGRDRRMVRGIGETDAAYAARLKDWLTDRRTCGAPFTLLKQLAGYCDPAGTRGCSFRTVDNSGNWYSRSSTGVETSSLATANWNWDGGTARGRFWAIIYPGTLWTAGENYGGTSDWGDTDRTWGSTMTPEQSATLRAIVADWKPAGTRCHTIIIAYDPATFAPGAPEPDGTWGPWSKVVAGVRVTTRLTTARYLNGS